MPRVSNFIVGFLNSCSLLLGLLTIAVSLYFYLYDNTECQKALRTPFLITGIMLSVVSLLGLIGSWGRDNFVMGIYLFVMFLLIVAFLAFTCFVFLVTNDGVSKAASRVGIKDNWLQNKIFTEKIWDKIRRCLIGCHVCQRLENDIDQKIVKKNLSPIQSGCCEPPTSCGFEDRNTTFWIVPKSGPPVNDSTDCTTWSNDYETLCYNCNSCKSGFVANIRKEWRLLAILNICITVFIIIVYSIGCCAKRNNKYYNW